MLGMMLMVILLLMNVAMIMIVIMNDDDDNNDDDDFKYNCRIDKLRNAQVVQDKAYEELEYALHHDGMLSDDDAA